MPEGLTVITAMDDPIAALVDQQDALTRILTTLDADGWHRPTRCEGWDVADVVLHLAQTNEMAIGSARGNYDEVLTRLTEGLEQTASVDEGAASMVQKDRGASDVSVMAIWTSTARELVAALAAQDPSKRVQWVAGRLSVRTLATTRLAETWIHAGDVAEALGTDLPSARGLALIARLAWRTLPYAFSSAGRPLPGPVAFELTGTDGSEYRFVPEGSVATVIRGPVLDLCLVAARRVTASATDLRGEGPDSDGVLELVRTYA